MVTDKQLGEQSHQLHTDPCNCGEAVFKRLPLLVTELACTCERDWRERTRPISEIGVRNSGTHCLDCGKPTRYSIAYHHFICEGCESYFTFNYNDFPPAPYGSVSWPPKNLLCKACDINVPHPISRRRRSAISFS